MVSRQDQRTCRSREGVVGVDVGDGEHDGNSDDGEAQRAVGADADGPRPINVHSSCSSLHSHAQSAQWGFPRSNRLSTWSRPPLAPRTDSLSIRCFIDGKIWKTAGLGNYYVVSLRLRGLMPLLLYIGLCTGRFWPIGFIVE